jgi:uncharacterized protein YjlB
LFLLLGTVFLASVSVSVGFAYWEGESPKYPKCLASCPRETDRERYLACHARCKLINDSEGPREKEGQEKQEPEQPQPREERKPRREEKEQVPRREQKEPQQEQEQEGHVERKKQQRHEQKGGQREEEEERQTREERERRPEEEEQDERGPRRQEKVRQQEQEQERLVERKKQKGQQEEHEQERHREKKQERQQEEQEPKQRGEQQHGQRKEEEEWQTQEERERRQEKEEQEEPGPRHQEKERQQEQEQERCREKKQQRQEEEEKQQKQNPFHFPSHKFQTLFKNKHGHIRVLPKFNITGELQNYRIVKLEARPQTFILTHHSDAEYLVVVVKGKALLTLVNPNNRESYNLEEGQVLRIPAGVTVYGANTDDNQNLKIVKLAIPVNLPGRFVELYPSGLQNPLSYLTGFSRETIEASFNRPYEEVQKTLIGEQKQSSEEGLLTKASKQQIKELSQHAKSSLRGSLSSFKSGPFSPRQLPARYSNKYGRFYEARPQDFQQLQDLGISVVFLEINKNALMLPNYNTRTICLVLVVEGKGRVELGVAAKDQQEEQEEQEESSHRQAPKFTAEVSQGDAYVIPAGVPVVLRAYEDLRVLRFGLNDENNQRNFLAGESDNVLNQIDPQAKELTFPGSAKQVKSLLERQKDSYFASATPQEEEEREQRQSGRLSSILGAFL